MNKIIQKYLNRYYKGRILDVKEVMRRAYMILYKRKSGKFDVMYVMTDGRQAMKSKMVN